MQNPYRHVSYKVLLLFTFSILACGTIQSSPSISLIELDCIKIYNGITQTPQDDNRSWEEVLEDVRKKIVAKRQAEKERIAAEEKAKKRKAEEKEKKRKAADEAAAEKERIAAAEKERIAAEEKEKKRKAVEDEKAKLESRLSWANAETRLKREEYENMKQVFYIFLTSILLLSWYLYSKIRKLKSNLEKQEKDISIVKVDLDKVKVDLDKAKNYFLTKTEELTKNKNINGTINQQLIERSDSIPKKEIIQTPKVVEKFFMSNPNKDGTFSSEEKITIYDQTSCYYEFEKTGDNLYEFFLINEVAARALKYNDTVIVPVCDIVDGSLQNSTNVDIIRYGKAVQSKDTFKVIEKLKIRLI